ncbi:LOW QUALITY PROTEIN: nucleosome assembly protein 1-like 3 [Urocitellus parryii]
MKEVDRKGGTSLVILQYLMGQELSNYPDEHVHTVDEKMKPTHKNALGIIDTTSNKKNSVVPDAFFFFFADYQSLEQRERPYSRGSRPSLHCRCRLRSCYYSTAVCGLQSRPALSCHSGRQCHLRSPGPHCRQPSIQYEPTEEECEWNSEDEEFSSDEEVQDDTPSEMPPLEGEEEEEMPKENSEVKVKENEVPKEIPEVKDEEKEVPKESPEVKAEEKELPKEIVDVKPEEKEVPKEIPEIKGEEADSTDCMEATPEEKEDPKEALQAKAEQEEKPKVTEPKARSAVREAHKRVPETRPKERVSIKRARKGKPKREDPKGIPDYWLTVLKNVDKLGPMIQKYDEPILKFLSDVRVKFSKPGQPISNTFEFHFLPNPYFRNELLMKTYIIKSKPDHNDPFFSWGWEIEDCKGCKIDWRRGKDVTVTTTHSRTTATGEIEIQPREVPNASFFNFFSPPEIPKTGKQEPREDAILDEDFEIGQILHDNVILKSIYYYTGEVNDTYYQDGRDYGNRKYRK